MRNPDRIPKILADIEKIWAQYPDLRLGQLILNVVSDPALYYIEDAALIEKMSDFYQIKTNDNE